MIEAQLGALENGWRQLSHPHLIRLLDAGRCQLGGHNFLFVVMEHAEQNLAQILSGRALTPDELRDLLPASLDTLAYLHGKNLVHGGIKPPNFLAVDDQLKRASDTIPPAGERTASTARPSLYDPPEVQERQVSTASDIWGLGITLVEALTQTAPAWSRERFESVSLPDNLAPEFVDMVQRCLNRDPGQRPSIDEHSQRNSSGRHPLDNRWYPHPRHAARHPSQRPPRPMPVAPPSAVSPASVCHFPRGCHVPRGSAPPRRPQHAHPQHRPHPPRRRRARRHPHLSRHLHPSRCRR